MPLDPASITHLSFDCYGTLIDWETGITDALQPLCEKYGVICSNEQLLELYARCEAAEESDQYRPYRDILRLVTRRIATEFGFHATEREMETLEHSIRDWPPFADTVDALQRLKTQFRLVIVSNIDDDLFAGSAEKLRIPFDHVITAAQVKAYKPSTRVFEHVQRALNLSPDRWLHVAQSLYHDITPANALGLQSVWVNRWQGKDGAGATPPAEATPTLEVPDLKTLADRLVG